MMLASRFLTYRVDHIATATVLSINSLLISSYVNAQVVPDGTLNTQVDFIEGQQKITGGKELGTYLFHSFKEFSPTVNFVTHFENNSNIENIFTRVTGGSASLIDGLIKTNGSASLFILNPAGIIFGNNAALEIGGSFIASTAESIIFADGTKFDTHTTQTEAILTISIPIGLQYGNSPGAISSNNTGPITLNVSPGNTIAFLGGSVNLQNLSIRAFSGNVEIASLSQGETLNVNLIANEWGFNYDNVENFEDINIHQNSQINTGGRLGNINLRGKSIILSSGTNIENATNSNFNGGNTSLLATNDIDLNNILLSNPVGAGVDESGISLGNSVTGEGGDIRIEAQKIKIRNGSAISSITASQGSGGDITINASKSLELSGFNEDFPSIILSGVSGVGEGGDIQINTGKLLITDGARIDSSTFLSGKAGDIVVNAHESIFISGSKSFFSSNFNQEVKFNSGLIASSGFDNANSSFFGESGNINVSTPQLSIENGGEISVSNFGQEVAGEITINVGELLLNDDSQITAITASGDGGSINISGSDLILNDESLIATTAGDEGNGGNITINANNLVLFDDSKIQANADQGNGGNITISAQGLLTEKNPEDVITADSNSDVEGRDGIVEITLPDDNSKLETTQARIASLAGEESLYKGCSLGTDFSANRFSYIGRGGIRRGPFDPLESQNAIADLGFGGDSAFENINIQTNNNLYNHDKIIKSSKPITEASAWIINEEGKVELVAQATSYSVPSECLFK